MNRHAILIRVCLACFGLGVFLPLSGCSAREGTFDSVSMRPTDLPAKTLTIGWQRLLDASGATCNRCGNTERSIDQAQRLLSAALKPLGFRVSVEKFVLTPYQFTLDTSESNRIWIGDEPLDKILGAKPGGSSCEGVCGGSSCRTMVVDGRTYETIPPELIVRAGLKVAADMLQPGPERAPFRGARGIDTAGTRN